MEKIIRCMFVAALALLLLFSVWSLWSVQSELREAKAALFGLQREAAAIARENDAFRQELERSGSEERLGQIAREQLGLVLPEDRIYIIGDEN